MRRLLLLLPLLAAAAPADERRIPVANFERIRVQGPFDVTVLPGKTATVRIAGKPGDADRVSARVEGDTLTLAGTGSSGPQTPLRIEVTAPRIAVAAVSGRGRLAVETATADTLDLTLNGFGTLAVRGIAADRIAVTAAGAGTLTLAGTARAARMRVVGQIEVEASALAAEELTLYSENASDGRLRAEGKARVTNVGPGAVSVSGKAPCEIRGKGAVMCAGNPPRRR